MSNETMYQKEVNEDYAHRAATIIWKSLYVNQSDVVISVSLSKGFTCRDSQAIARIARIIRKSKSREGE